jgi:hypothetical protein
MEKGWASFNYVELWLTLDDARSAHHQGQCDDDVRDLSEVPYVKAQLDALGPDAVRKELKEYGAWAADELADHERNLQRLLWLAAGDVVESRH